MRVELSKSKGDIPVQEDSPFEYNSFFRLSDSSGAEMEIEVLLIASLEDDPSTYLVFSPRNCGPSSRVRLTAAKYNPMFPGKILPIKSEEDKDFITTTFFGAMDQNLSDFRSEHPIIFKIYNFFYHCALRADSQERTLLYLDKEQSFQPIEQ